jgi:hypothetical protein
MSKDTFDEAEIDPGEDLDVEPDVEPDEESLDEEALDEGLDDDLDVVLDDDLDVVLDIAVIEPDDLQIPTVGTEDADTPATGDDDEGMDLDEELHPDDVEAPLDALLQEKTASATLEDDEDELEEEDDADALVDGPTKIVPRRPGEFVCSSCFLVLPRHQLADAKQMLCRDCA